MTTNDEERVWALCHLGGPGHVGPVWWYVNRPAYEYLDCAEQAKPLARAEADALQATNQRTLGPHGWVFEVRRHPAHPESVVAPLANVERSALESLARGMIAAKASIEDVAKVIATSMGPNAVANGSVVTVTQPIVGVTAPRPFKVGDRITLETGKRVVIGTNRLEHLDAPEAAAVGEPECDKRVPGFYGEHVFGSGTVQPAQPKPRCGQTWRIARTRPSLHWQYPNYRVLVGQTFALLDYDHNRGVYTVRVDDGLRSNVIDDWLPYVAEYVSGPTEPETPREELERVIKLEAERRPEGVTQTEWLAQLLRWGEPPAMLQPYDPKYWHKPGAESSDTVLRVRQLAEAARNGSKDAAVRRLSIDGYGRVRS